MATEELMMEQQGYLIKPLYVALHFRPLLCLFDLQAAHRDIYNLTGWGTLGFRLTAG